MTTVTRRPFGSERRGRFRRVHCASAVALTLCCSASFADENHGAPPFGDAAARIATKTPIKHLVVIFQENRTFDHYFGTYPEAANIPGEEGWVGIPAPAFHARPHTPKANNYLTNPDVFFHNPNISLTGAQANPQRWRPADGAICNPVAEPAGLAFAGLSGQLGVDGGRMDKFAPSAVTEGCPLDGTGAMNYFDGNSVTALWNYAQYYAMSDAFFSTIGSESSTGHFNLVSGTNQGAIWHGPTINSTEIYQNPTNGSLTVIGDPESFFDDCGPGAVEKTGRNVGDLLNAKNISWGWFGGGFRPTQPAVLNGDGSTQTPAVCGQSHTLYQYTIDDTTFVIPNPTINFTTDIHIVNPDWENVVAPFMYYASTANPHHLPPSSVAAIGSSDEANHQYDTLDFLAAVKVGNFPAVSFLKAAKYAWGHPDIAAPQVEQAYMVQMINEIMNLPEWESTAIVITYDDWGGTYDHVPPPVLNPSNTPIDFHCGNGEPVPGDGYARCRLGPRLPFLVISPWAKENYIDHTLTEQASILRFIEENWGLGFIDGPKPLPPGTESFDRFSGSIMGMFDFENGPNMRQLILDPIRGTVQR